MGTRSCRGMQWNHGKTLRPALLGGRHPKAIPRSWENARRGVTDQVPAQVHERVVRLQRTCSRAARLSHIARDPRAPDQASQE